VTVYESSHKNTGFAIKTQQGFPSQRPQGTTSHKVIEGTRTIHAHTHTIMENPHNHQKTPMYTTPWRVQITLC